MLPGEPLRAVYPSLQLEYSEEWVDCMQRSEALQGLLNDCTSNIVVRGLPRYGMATATSIITLDSALACWSKQNEDSSLHGLDTLPGVVPPKSITGLSHLEAYIARPWIVAVAGIRDPSDPSTKSLFDFPTAI